jgi:hypothetical protein
MTPSCRRPKVEVHCHWICDTVRSVWFLTGFWIDCSAVYYRVYNEDGAIRSLHPLNPNDPSLSRIYATSVAPPHTVASLKHCLCRVEAVTGSTALFTATPSSSMMDDRDRISFLTEASPGSTIQNPIAFVVQTPYTERRILETTTIDSPSVSSETRYRASVFLVYFHLSRLIFCSILSDVHRRWPNSFYTTTQCS